MSSISYISKYDEIDKLLRRYHARRKKEKDSLLCHVQKEISDNVELRKYVSLLKLQLQVQISRNEAQQRMLSDFRNETSSLLGLLRSGTGALIPDIVRRLENIERQERRHEESVAELNEKLRRYSSQLCISESNSNLRDGTLRHAQGAVPVESQHEEELIYASHGFPLAGENTNVGRAEQEENTNDQSRHSGHPLSSEEDECAARAALITEEAHTRSDIMNTHFLGIKAYMKGLFTHLQFREVDLRRAEELLCLQQCELASRLRIEADLSCDSRAREELHHRRLASQCKAVVRCVGAFLDSVSEMNPRVSIADLKGKIRAILLPSLGEESES